MLSSPWSDIHHIVCAPYGVLVMFHDDEGISVVSQFFQRFNELVVVSLMKPYGRLIQDVENTHER